jgi:hypothetical protein
VYDLSPTSGVQERRWGGACRSAIEPLNRDWHPDSISSISLDGNWFIISIKIWVSGGRNIKDSYNVVTSALEALWILSLFEEVWYRSEQDLPVICRIAEQKLSVEVHSRKLQLNYTVRMTEAILGSLKCNIRTYILVKIQLSVVTYHRGLCIYGKRVVHTFFQRIGWRGAWQLWQLSGGLHIPIKHRFRYLLRPSGMSRACI